MYAGVLSSAVSMLLVLRLGTWAFGGRALAFQAELYGGLLLFLGYILVDTQVRARMLPQRCLAPSVTCCCAWRGRWVIGT